MLIRRSHRNYSTYIGLPKKRNDEALLCQYISNHSACVCVLNKQAYEELSVKRVGLYNIYTILVDGRRSRRRALYTWDVRIWAPCI